MICFQLKENGKFASIPLLSYDSLLGLTFEDDTPNHRRRKRRHLVELFGLLTIRSVLMLQEMNLLMEVAGWLQDAIDAQNPDDTIPVVEKDGREESYVTIHGYDGENIKVIHPSLGTFIFSGFMNNEASLRTKEKPACINQELRPLQGKEIGIQAVQSSSPGWYSNERVSGIFSRTLDLFTPFKASL